MITFGLLASSLVMVVGQPYLPNFFFDQKHIPGGFSQSGVSNIRGLDLSQELAFDGTGNPPDRSSGGGRAPCSSLVVAITPGAGTFSEGEDCVAASDAMLAYTSDNQPRFWLYIPGDHEAGTVLKVQIRQERQVIEVKDFPLPTTAGLISVQLDVTLESGRPYIWTAEVMVNTGRGRASNPLAGGMVEYRPMESEVATQISLLAPLDRAQQYGEQGLWYDALEELANLRRAEPDNAEVLAAWRGLLASYGLEIFADQPFLDCCLVTD